MSIADFTALPVSRAVEAAAQIKLNEREEKIAGRILREIARAAGISERRRAGLHLAGPLGGDAERRRRPAHPAGNADRLQAARRAVRAGRAVDRPASPRQRSACCSRSESLRDLGNTVLVVEHDEETIRRADYVIDLGPGAGRHGGEVVAQRHAGADRG